jgi:esterase/lipase
MNAFNIIDKVKTYKKIGHIKSPIKIIHGTDDELIDCNNHGRYLASLVKNPLQNQWLEGFGHYFSTFIDKIDLTDIIY